MARVTYQASAQNRPWSPDLLPDTADRILKQSEDYIKKLQAARDFEAAQDAEFIQQYSGSLQRGVDQKRQVDSPIKQDVQRLLVVQLLVMITRPCNGSNLLPILV